MKTLIALGILILFALCCVNVKANDPEYRDICVLGGGIGGMGAAVMYKDLHPNASLVVLEQTGMLGGCCNTQRFTPPPGETIFWNDVGVEVFPNTTAANALGLGPWTFNSEEFFSRFGKVIPTYYSQPTTYLVNLKNGDYYGPAPPPNYGPAFVEALQRLLAYEAQYSWLDFAQPPSQIPGELLIPFDEFVENLNLSALYDTIFIGFLWSGGLGYFKDLTTMYALENLSPTILTLADGQTQGITMYGGCYSLYEGMEAYIGSQNVITNAQVTKVRRPATGHSGISTVSGHIKDPSGRSIVNFKYKCGNVFVGFPPTLQNLSPAFDLDQKEIDFFKKVRVRPYYAGAVDMEGSLANQPISIQNVNPDNTLELPTLPAVTLIQRNLTYGPVQIGTVGSAPHGFDVEKMYALTQRQLNNINPSLVNSSTQNAFYLHQFQPYYLAEDLEQVPSPPSFLRDELDGYRYTTYFGAIESFASHVQILERTLHVIKKNFPAI